MPRLTFLLALLLWSIPWGASQAGQTRLALVIGNAGYRHAQPLVNSLHDARDLAGDLRATGFEVMEAMDTELSGLLDAIDRFATRLHEQGGVGLLYYSGHGVQVEGENYLVPIDAELKRKNRIKYEAFALNDLLERMGGRGAGSINLVILDACRDNPFESTRGGGTRGLARINAPESTLILYAAKPGQTASDNPQGRNGLFTQHLREAIRQPGVNVETAFANVVKQVYEESERAQYPWKEGVLLHPFAFVPEAPGTGTPETGVTPAPAGANPEVLFWETVKDSADPAQYGAYLMRYPQGLFAELARLKVQAAAHRPPSPAQGTGSQRPPDKTAAPFRRALVSGISASSFLSSQQDGKGRRFAYGPDTVMDGDPLTAWVEGAPGHGIGEWLRLEFRETARIQAISINGEYKGNKNNRLRRVGIVFSTGEALEVELRDSPGMHRFQLNPPVAANSVTLTIREVYPGTRFADTPIAEVAFE